ncbi:MAG: MFS transporter [Micrococcales bacterium]|nr:MFS transporter [Micrococcales bacterium]
MRAVAALRPLRHRDYRLLAASLVASLFGAGVLVVALVWQVVALGGGPGQLGWVTTAQAGGLLITALPGGVLADRLPQRVILLCVEGVKAVAIGGCAALSLTGQLHLGHLIAAALVGGVADGLYYPAYSAFLPKLVPAEDLLPANGLEGIFRPTLLNAVGPAVAGAVVAAISPGAALTLAALGAALAAGALLPVQVPGDMPGRVTDAATAVRTGDNADDSCAPGAGSDSRPTDQGTPHVHPVASVLTDLLDGFRFMVATPWLWATLGFASLAVLAIMGPFDVLLPFAIKDHAGGGPSDHALVLAAFGIGGALGSLVVASRPMPRRYLTSMILLWGWGSLPVVLMGTTGSIWVMVSAAFVVGAAFQAATVIWGTLLQRRVPAALLGRVSSLDFFVSLLFMPISMALAVPVSSVVGLSGTFVAAGAVPATLAMVFIYVAKLPADEIAHPLDRDARSSRA